ncbi:uncharacterized protein [Montipora capricornis]|uniref:uncharacterized protein n=1 Tax=Montipora capricornis TaxID=246305 RepID=UPI0035F19342
MDSVFNVFCALIISASLQSVVCEAAEQRLDGSSDVWEIRIRTTLSLLKTQRCWGLSRGAQCNDSSILGSLDPRRMRLHVAEGPNKFRVVLPDRKVKRLVQHSSRNKSYDAVFVLDPYPEAGFGHQVFLFLVSYDVNKTTCKRSMNGAYVFTDRGECIRRAEKFPCQNHVSVNGQHKCEINFVPLVYEESDTKKTQRLQCRQEVKDLNFTTCKAEEGFLTQCSDNEPRCDHRSSKPERFCGHKQCDHAVLISGGWNSFTSHERYRKNLRNVWTLLHSNMRYKEQHIRTFLGQGHKEELAQEQIKKSYAVDRTTKVRQYIKNLCSSTLCVDTLTLYLTGPAKSDGALMFWDRRGDGIADKSELYRPKDLLDDIKNCSANRVFLVADYSYSGEMIGRLKKRIGSHPNQFRNIVAISSTGRKGYAWRSDFTDAFVNKNTEGPRTKCLTQVFEEVKQGLQNNGSLSTPEMIAVNSAANATLNGYPCNEPWKIATMRHSCQLIRRENVPIPLP